MKRLIKGTGLTIIVLIMVVVPLFATFMIPPPDIKVDIRVPEHKPTYRNAIVFPHNQTEIWVNRLIKPSEFVYLKVIDDINITNTRDRPFSAIQLYYDRKFWDRAIRVRVFGQYRDDEPRPLEYSLYYISGDYVGLTVVFYIYLDKYAPARKNTFRVRIIFEFADILKVKPYKDKVGIYLNISPCPFLPYPIKRINVKLVAPEDGSLPENVEDVVRPNVDYEKKGTNISFTRKDIPPMNFSLGIKGQLKRYKFGEDIGIVWTMDKAPPVVPYMERTIVVTQSYKIEVTDRISVSVFSIEKPSESPTETKWKVEGFRVGLMPNVSKIEKIYDDAGPLQYRNTTDDDISENIKTIEVDLKSRPIIAGEIRNITIKYMIQLNEKFLGDDNKFRVNTTFGPVINTTIKLFSLKIKSYVPIQITIPANYTKRISDISSEKSLVVLYRCDEIIFTNLPESLNGEMKLVFGYSTIYSLRPFFVLSIYTITSVYILVELGLLIRIMIARIMTPREIRKIESIERLIKAYETIIAYDKNIWADTYNNLIIKRPSAGFIDDLRKKNTTITKQYEKLLPLLNKLRVEREFYDYVIDLEKLEERINIVKQIIISLTTDFVAGKIDKEKFRERAEALLLELKDLLNRRERIISSIRDIYLTKIM